ncbi:MAG: hypothetical protein AB1806_03020 [Acidobacteriota bacterium]
MNDRLADALLSILERSGESAILRSCAAVSLGPVLEDPLGRGGGPGCAAGLPRSGRSSAVERFG